MPPGSSDLATDNVFRKTPIQTYFRINMEKSKSMYFNVVWIERGNSTCTNRKGVLCASVAQGPSTSVSNLVRHYGKWLHAQKHVTVEHPSDLIFLLRKRWTEVKRQQGGDKGIYGQEKESESKLAMSKIEKGTKENGNKRGKNCSTWLIWRNNSSILSVSY